MKKKVIITVIISVIVIILAVGIGSVFISPEQIFTVIWDKIFGFNFSGYNKSTNQSIIWQLRLPRVFLAFITGAALSVSGVVFQSVLKNPLASPYTLGVSSGASLGVSVFIAFGLSISFLKSFALPIAGLVTGLFTVFLAVFISSKIDKNLKSTTVVLTGMAFSLFINAFITLICGMFPQKSQKIIQWQWGTFSSKGWEYVNIFFPILIIGIILVMFFTKELDIMTFGEEQAKAMGVETVKMKWILLIVTSFLTAAAVAFSGVIGFVDLIAPHISRKIFSSKHKILVPMSALLGGTFMVIADLVSRTVTAPREIPVSAVTALIGAPFFIFVFMKRRKADD